MFSTPQVNIYSEDVVRSVDFYRSVGFQETFRTPLGGTLRLAWVADPDNNPIELVQRRS